MNEPSRNRSLYLLLLALTFGLAIGFVDTRPAWDDTGITAGAVFLSSALLGALMPSRAWVWALAVGGTIVLFNLAVNGGFGALLALCIAVAGAYAGAFFRRMFGSSATAGPDKQ